MVKTSPAWEWFTTVVEKSKTKPHPDVQCKHCDKVIRNCQLGRDLLPHAASKCPNAPLEVKETALEEIEKAAELKKKRKPSGGAAPQRAKKPKASLFSPFGQDTSDEDGEAVEGLKKSSYFMTPFEVFSDDDDDEEPANWSPHDTRKLEVMTARMLNSMNVPFTDEGNSLLAVFAAFSRAKMPTAARLKEVMPERTHPPTADVLRDQYWAAKQRYWDSLDDEDEDME